MDDNTKLPEKRNRKNRKVTKSNEPPKPPVTPKFLETPPKQYDTTTIDAFISTVFGESLSPDEHILTWAVPVRRFPQYPVSDSALLDTLDTTRQPLALYYGTATCRQVNGELRNRQASFEKLYVIVLDDIGTKVSLDDLPGGMTPTYIIESSQGNFQYGYVLDTPIDNFDAAKALVQVVYDSGVTDAGGAMPNKLVRLPDGVNGKKGVKEGFITRLVTMDGPKWSPQGILDKLDTGIEWSELLEDAQGVLRSRTRRSTGATPWSPLFPRNVSTEGVVDTVAEWLYEQGMVFQEVGGWMTVLCPWHDQHTDADQNAGYSPLGQGDYPESRGFHCFHEHCKLRKTPEYLSHLTAMGAPQAGVRDLAGKLTAQWVYDAEGELCWDIKTTDYPNPVSHKAFCMVNPHSTTVVQADGKEKTIKDHQLWTTSPARVTVYGRRFLPNSTDRLVEYDGRLRINTYSPPIWPAIEPGERHVAMFTDFIDYLIPADECRSLFLDWLAAKAQDMGFRGPALLMVARRQGTGRTTLGDMITALFHARNVEAVPFTNLTREDGFNEWRESPIVITDETLTIQGPAKYQVYEKLKDLLDPRAKQARINPKYGRQRVADIHTSFLFFSNHSDALAMATDDRRFAVIENPAVPAPPDYFVRLNAWLDEDWEAHIWNWLLARTPDLERMYAPPAMSAAKAAMLESTGSPIDALVKTILSSMPSEYVIWSQIMQLAEHFASRIGLYDIPRWEQVLKMVVGKDTAGFDAGFKLSTPEGKQQRPRVIISRIDNGSLQPGKKPENFGRKRAINTLVLDRFDFDKVCKTISDSLDLQDL